MAYMVYQRYTTAILEAYRDVADVAEHLEQARLHRQWLESLDFDPGVKAALVEQAKTVEEAFDRLVRRQEGSS